MENTIQTEVNMDKAHSSHNMEYLANLLYDYKLTDAQTKMMSLTFSDREVYDEATNNLKELGLHLINEKEYDLLDIKVDRFMVLFFTKRYTKYSNKVIAIKLGVNRKTITRMVKLLLKKGFLKETDNKYTYTRKAKTRKQGR